MIKFSGVVAGGGGGGQEGPWSLNFFRNRWIFVHFNVSLENFRAFAVGKDKGFEFYQNSLNLPPFLLYSCHDTLDQISDDSDTSKCPIAYFVINSSS